MREMDTTQANPTRLRVIPGRRAIFALAAGSVALFVALLLDTPVALATRVAIAWLLAIVLAAAVDYLRSRRAWRRSSPRITRRLPPAFAIGAKRSVVLSIDIEGAHVWRGRLHDHADPSLVTEGLPIQLVLPAATRFDATYAVTPTRRGEVTFAATEVRSEIRNCA